VCFILIIKTNKNERKTMSKTYEILTSETIYKTVLIEAENEKEAEEKINTGLWGPEDVIDEDTSDFYIHETKEIDEEVAA
jgi:hypothetical protein